MVLRKPGRVSRAFTLIELLVVIAIIAILAAILFPAFSLARENARQTNTLSNMHTMYVGAKLFNEDEGHFPSVLFGYAETPDGALSPPNRPATPSDTTITPMDKSTQNFLIASTPSSINRGYLYHEQVKDYIDFTCPDNLGKTNNDITIAYWPLNSPISIANGGTAASPIAVTWTPTASSGTCPTFGDRDIPSAGYAGLNKLYYVKDSMDIGPMLDSSGKVVYQPDGKTPKYELHYSPDWSHLLGTACEAKDAGGNLIISQLKYRNPPSDRTVLTYVTQHTATAGSKVLILLLNGTVRKIDPKQAGQQLPVAFTP